MRYRGICNQIHQLDHYTTLVGGNQNIICGGKKTEIKEDIILQSIYGTTIWGYLQDNFNQPLGDKKINLVKQCTEPIEGKGWFEIVDTTYTDQEGFYKMEACIEDDESLSIIVDTTCIEGKEVDAYQVSECECEVGRQQEVCNEIELSCEHPTTEDTGLYMPQGSYIKGRGQQNRSCTNYIRFYGDKGNG